MKEDFDFRQGNFGLVAPMPPGKVRITIRIDADILNWFRERVNESGGYYQTMMNDALRAYIHSKDKTLEETLRKVIREELRARMRTAHDPLGGRPGRRPGSGG